MHQRLAQLAVRIGALLNDRARRNINPKVFTISTVTVVSLTMPAAPSLKLATPLEGSQIPQL
jgi:hypothetical protein